jgi:SanA protein
MTYRFWRNILTVLILLLIIMAESINYYVVSTTRTQLFSDVKAIPKNKVGLLLGTAKYQDKARKIINQYYQHRIDATVDLYMAGKIDYIIVSGDNSSQFYNEPALMKADLIARGVPAKKIFMDNAGFRTLDSILRCRDIFGQDHFTVISQEFHNQRAVFIANHKKVSAVAYNAADGDSFWDTTLRERLARVKMVADLIFNTQAKYYGETINIPK